MQHATSYSHCYDFAADAQEAREAADAADESRIYAELLTDAEALAQAWADNAIDLTGDEVAVALRLDNEAAGNALIGAAVRQIVQLALRREAGYRREQAEADRQRKLRAVFAGRVSA